MIKVILNFEVHHFDKYSDALQFKLKNGGTLYQKVYEC